jgi:hypothetical protein
MIEYRRLLALLVLFLLGSGTASLAATAPLDSDSPWYQQDETGASQVNLYFYWSARCASMHVAQRRKGCRVKRATLTTLVWMQNLRVAAQTGA